MSDINYSQYRALIQLYIKGFDEEITTTKLCETLGYNKSHPYFRELLRILLKNGTLTAGEIIGNVKLYLINNKKLSEFIRETTIFNITGKFIESNRPLDYSY